LNSSTIASEQNAVLAVCPELGLSAYTDEDLFFQDALLDAVETELSRLVAASEGCSRFLWSVRL
jgi:NAD+ synthase (glutamine-hydrolysing)